MPDQELTKEEELLREIQSLADTVEALKKNLFKAKKELKEHKAALEIQVSRNRELSEERDQFFTDVLFQKSIIRKLVQ